MTEQDARRLVTDHGHGHCPGADATGSSTEVVSTSATASDGRRTASGIDTTCRVVSTNDRASGTPYSSLVTGTPTQSRTMASPMGTGHGNSVARNAS